MKKKVKKKNLLVEVRKPMIFRHEANEKHNEVTVVKAQYAIPMKEITMALIPEVLDRIKKMSVGFPEANITFNYQHSPAFLFTCKGKAERRGDDVPNQELGDKIALTKCEMQACKIGREIMIIVSKTLKEEAEYVLSVSEFYGNQVNRGLSYIRKQQEI